MVEGLQFGGKRRRSAGGDTWLLGAAIIAAVASYHFFYSPIAVGSWEAAATQLRKKYDRVMLLYPAWERAALNDLQDVAVVLVDGPQHFELAGLREVLFASEGPGPEELVRNLFFLSEWRDFAGKAVAVLRVAERGLVVDFPRLQAAVEDPPGIAQCELQGEAGRCAQPNVIIERRQVWLEYTSSRCVWAKTNPDRPLFLRWRDLSGAPVRRAMLFVWPAEQGASAKDATLQLVSRGQRVARVQGGEDLQTQTLALDPASDDLEVVIDAPNGACFDVELMP